MAKLSGIVASWVVVLLIGAGGAFADPIAPAGKQIGQDPQGRAIYQVDANGISIGYKLVGAGAPLVMIMGLGGTAENWPPQVVEALSKNYQLIVPDNRGMGHSSANDTVFSYPLFAADVIGLLDALGVKQTHVLGYSMGSTIAQQLLLQYPDRFSKALIHATSTDGSNVAKALHGRVPPDPIVARQVEATTHWKTPLQQLPAIPNQVMLVVGTADDVVGAESSKILASAIPGAWLVQFKGATHHLMYETPAGFAAAALTFFDTDETVTVKALPAAPVVPPSAARP
jgi:pimeloyl-ACP methyl ester carboxylesterase